jgi:membrane protease YdiL (CAAX protease family)
LPLLVLGGPRGVLELFHAGTARFAKLGTKTQALLWWPLIAPLGVLLSPYSKLPSANLPIIAVSLILGLVIGVTEELLWRGVYARLFPSSIWLNTIYPTIGFAAWHIAPLSILPTRFPGAPASFLIYCVLLGLSYAYSARTTGSIRWCTVSHCIHDALGLGGFAYALWFM